MQTLEEAYRHCRRVARSRARNFYFSFLLLSRERRDAMCAVYAFMRHADDIADDTSSPVADRRRELDGWKLKLRSALLGDPGGDPALAAVRDTVERYDIPHTYLLDLLQGMESDLAGPDHQTFEDLYGYCYRAASVVGMTTIHVFGFDSDAALPLAERCGVAFQLTNILRDVSADADMGRVYLPACDLERFGLRPADLLAGSVSHSDDRFQALMEFQWQRAHAFYRESGALLPMVSPCSRAALWAMMTIYFRLLGRIRQSRYDVLQRRIRLSLWSKLWIVARALKWRTTGGLPPFPA